MYLCFPSSSFSSLYWGLNSGCSTPERHPSLLFKLVAQAALELVALLPSPPAAEVAGTYHHAWLSRTCCLHLGEGSVTWSLYQRVNSALSPEDSGYQLEGRQGASRRALTTAKYFSCVSFSSLPSFLLPKRGVPWDGRGDLQLLRDC